MTKITIAIPTYNRPEWLSAAVKSVLNQTIQDFEIIIFDSGSDYDVSSRIAALNDSRIKLQKSENYIDGTANFKRIFNFKYNTEYLIIFHDDDTMHPQLIERELTIMEKYRDLVWIGTGLKFVHDGSKMNIFQLLGILKNFKIYDTADLVRLILNNFHLSYGTVMYRTVFIAYVDLYSKYYKWFDRPFLIELSKKGKIAVINEELVNYRVHQGQGSRADNLDKLPYLLNLFNYYKENLPMPLSSSDKKLFYAWSSNHLILSLASFAENFRSYIDLLKKCHGDGLFKPLYLNGRGIFYFLKVIKKYLC